MNKNTNCNIILWLYLLNLKVKDGKKYANTENPSKGGTGSKLNNHKMIFNIAKL